MSATNQENMLVLLSGENRPALLSTIDRLLARLKNHPDIPLEATASQLGRAERLAIVSPRDELEDRLKTARVRLVGLSRARLVIRDRGIFLGVGDTAGRVAFLFPGQGSQHIGMLSGLYEKLPQVRAWFDALDNAHSRAGEMLPSRLIFSHDGISADERRKRERALFDIGRGAQLGTVANLALFEVLSRLGIEADVVLGHSNGEHAAVLAACADLESNRDYLCDWLRRASRAGLGLGEPALPEKMIVVTAVERERLEAVVARHPGNLFWAMDNCPHQQVLAGRQATVDEAAKEITAAGGISGDLPFTRAYHTPLFAEWAGTLRAYYEELPLQKARVPIISCLTSSAIDPEPASIRDNMAGQWTSPVRFRETIEALHAEGVRSFIEVGPGSKLTAFVEDTLRGRPHLAVCTSSAHRGDLLQLQHLLAALHAHGVVVDARRFDLLTQVLPVGVTSHKVRTSEPAPSGVAVRAGGFPVELATATALHSDLIAGALASMTRMENMFRAVTENAPRELLMSPSTSEDLPLLGEVKTIDRNRLVAERLFTRANDPFVVDHCLGRTFPNGRGPQFPLPVLPFTASLEIVAEAAQRMNSSPVKVISNVRANRWLALDGGELTVRTESERRGQAIHVALSDSLSNAPGAAFEGTVHLTDTLTDSLILTTSDRLTHPPSRWTADEFYRRYAFHGPSFQGISRVVALDERSIEAELRVTALPGLEAGTLQLDPALLDCAGQLVAFWLLEHGKREPSFGIFPFAVRRVILHHRPLPPGQHVRCRGAITSHSEIKTEASFVFVASDGRVIATIEGLEQRLIDFPHALARWIFGGEAAEFSQPADSTLQRVVRRIAVSDWALLTESWGIWQRALAHLLLSEEELAAWLKLSQSADLRLMWLLERIVVKETVRRWAELRSTVLPDPANIVMGEGSSIRCKSFGLMQPNCEIRREEGAIVAAVW
jgi:malonyl CoA-acyl carrier protein transacylase